mmetsp:Transcript_4316/g.10417  ORF Transcript_4316/g.10417 Transcript_4316/m.10417 type:complete len:108 (+) Transcript_4316:621-944(+)
MNWVSSAPGRGDCVPMFLNSVGCARAATVGRNAAVANPSSAARRLHAEVGCQAVTTVVIEQNTIANKGSKNKILLGIDGAEATIIVEDKKFGWLVGRFRIFYSTTDN